MTISKTTKKVLNTLAMFLDDNNEYKNGAVDALLFALAHIATGEFDRETTISLKFISETEKEARFYDCETTEMYLAVTFVDMKEFGWMVEGYDFPGVKYTLSEDYIAVA